MSFLQAAFLASSIQVCLGFYAGAEIVRGGKPPESGPCDPFAPHGYFGREAETVDAIAAWMLKKSHPKDID